MGGLGVETAVAQRVAKAGFEVKHGRFGQTAAVVTALDFPRLGTLLLEVLDKGGAWMDSRPSASGDHATTPATAATSSSAGSYSSSAGKTSASPTNAALNSAAMPPQKSPTPPTDGGFRRRRSARRRTDLDGVGGIERARWGSRVRTRTGDPRFVRCPEADPLQLARRRTRTSFRAGPLRSFEAPTGRCR